MRDRGEKLMDTEVLRRPGYDADMGLKATLANTTQAGTGEWLEVEGLHPMSVHVLIENATVILCGHNAIDKPANSNDGFNLFGSITASDLFEINLPLNWIKAKPVTVTGSVVVHFVGLRR